jgi:hypothetical protein
MRGAYEQKRKWLCKPTSTAQAGYQVVQLFGLILVGLMISALAIDFAYYYMASNVLHTAADSAALAAATELYRSPQPDPGTKMNHARLQAQLYIHENQPQLTLKSEDVIFGYIDPANKTYNRATFATPTPDPQWSNTHGYNAVWVRTRKTLDSDNGQLNTIMANLVGIHKMDLKASAVAMVDQSIGTLSNGSVRPIYACAGQVNQAMQDGNLENDIVRVYSNRVELNGAESTDHCPIKGSGNWSFADFTDCRSTRLGLGTMRTWLENGYAGTVRAGQCYGTQAGDFISRVGEEVNSLISREMAFPIPVYDSWGGSGTRARVNVSGFVGFQMTRYVSANRSQNGSPYIEGHFSRYLCKTGCISDRRSKPAGTIVKLRLASRS